MSQFTYGFDNPNPDAATADTADTDKINYLWEDQVMAQMPPKYVINKVLQEDTLVVLWGASKSLKSFLALDMSLCMTHGHPWHGHAVKQSAVAYVCAEGAGGFGKRVRAWKHHHKITRSSPFLVIPQAVNLLDDDEVENLITLLEDLQREHDIKFGMVNIDTLARCTADGEENSAKEMGHAVSNADKIRERLKCVVLIVHHCGKDADRGPRGSYALYCAVNTGISVDRDNDVITMLLDKQKDGEDGLIMRFQNLLVKLPLRPGVEPEDSLVLIDYHKVYAQAAPPPADGEPIDKRIADLITIATKMPDGEMTATQVAKLAFGDERAPRVRDAVPIDWVEVNTTLGIRQLRRDHNDAKGSHCKIHCRHIGHRTPANGADETTTGQAAASPLH
jgi:hypothetical protein